MKASEAYRRIWAVVKKIPRGRVATYGQVAHEAGYPKQPRLAGYALSHLPAARATARAPACPWHRVINAQGRISFAPGSKAQREQKRRLEEEGVAFIAGRVDLERWRWRPHSAAPVLD